MTRGEKRRFSEQIIRTNHGFVGKTWGFPHSAKIQADEPSELGLTDHLGEVSAWAYTRIDRIGTGRILTCWKIHSLFISKVKSEGSIFTYRSRCCKYVSLFCVGPYYGGKAFGRTFIQASGDAVRNLVPYVVAQSESLAWFCMPNLGEKSLK